jgi:TetR/AcrR family transcriptional regulator, fatty acid metabolism regulator protein
MDKKELVRLSATKIIAKEGFHKTKVQSIADDAKIAVGTVYIYYKNKESILDYIFETQNKKIAEFSKSLENLSTPPFDKIKKILRFHLKELGDNPSLAKVLAQESRGPPMNGTVWTKDESVGVPEIFRIILEDLKLKGKIRDIDTQLFGAIIFFVGIETAYLLQIQGKKDKHLKEFNDLITFIINGIEKKI